MPLKLKADEEIKNHKSEIDTIGSTVNQPNLYSDIKKSIELGESFFFGSNEGAVILNLISSKGVLVWVAVKNSAIQTEVNWLSYQGEIESLAREIDAQYVEFWSVRKGFYKVAKKLGYTSRQDLWNGVDITVWRKSL